MSGRILVKIGPLARRAGMVVILTWLSVEIHETGHFLVYAALGYRARMSFQRVSPLEAVPAVLDHWAKFAGPALSLVAAVACLLVARRRPGFGWATASFTNGSIRLFPLSMDFLRAVKGNRPFSDEGEVALALTASPLGRAAIILCAVVPFVGLTVLAAKAYPFETRCFLKVLGVYALSLGVGILVVVLDDLLGLNH